MSGRPAPPGGVSRPPVSATTSQGRELDLYELARRTCVAYDAEFPDERDRYGPAGHQWCVHDNQHVLNWAVQSLTTKLDFDAELAWLARVLESRAFPLPRMARNLELLAATVRDAFPDESELAARIDDGATFISSQSSFLPAEGAAKPRGR